MMVAQENKKLYQPIEVDWVSCDKQLTRDVGIVRNRWKRCVQELTPLDQQALRSDSRCQRRQFRAIALISVLIGLLLPGIAQAASQNNLATTTEAVGTGITTPSAQSTISVTADGVVPTTVTIIRGMQVTWSNDTSHSIQLSNQRFGTQAAYSLLLPLIARNNLEQFNVAQSAEQNDLQDDNWISDPIAPGQQYTRIYDAVGTYQYYASHLTGAVGTIAVVDERERIVVSPTALLLTSLNESHLLSAQVYDPQGLPAGAPINWHSSQPATVAVDQNGRVTALVRTGSAYIYATVDGIQSEPVTVLIAQPATGAVLVTDAQVATPIQPVDADTSPELGTRYRTTLRNMAAPPPIGAIILGKESAALAGKVVATTETDGDQIEVTFVSVPLTELFAALHFTENLDAATTTKLALAPAMSKAVAVHYGADGSVVMRFAAADIEVIRTEAERTTFTIGPFECESTATPTLSISGIEVTFQNALDPGFIIEIEDYTLQRLLLKLAGEISVALAGKITFTDSFTGEITCRYQTVIAVIPVGGALAAVFAPVVPAGLGFDLKSDLRVAQLGIQLLGNAGTALGVGFDYQAGDGFTIFKEFKISKDGRPELILPNLATNNRVDTTLYFYGLTGLGASVFPDTPTGRVTWNMIDVKFGPQYTLSGATPFAQSVAVDYASAYGLQLHGRAGVGEQIETMLRYVAGPVTLDLTEILNFAVESNLLLAESPNGLFTSDKSTTAPNEPVVLTVELEPLDLQFPGIGYNVNHVDFYRLRNQTLELLDTVSAAAGQNIFQTSWVPALAEVGDHKFYAFVSSRNLPNLPLEVAKNSALNVLVRAVAPTNTPTNTPTGTPTSTPTNTPTSPSCLVPDAPGLTSPVNITTIDSTPTFRWARVGDNMAYQLQILVGNQVVVSLITDAQSFTPAPLAEGLYTWRVRTIYQTSDCNEAGDWSAQSSVTIDPLTAAVDLFVSGNIAYIAAGSDGLRVVNVADPGAPALLGHYGTEYSANSIYVVGTTVYLTDNSEYVYLIDVADPTQPTLLSIYSQVTDPDDIFVANQVAYIVSDEGDFDIVDVSNPRNPLFWSQVPDSPLVMGSIFVSGNIAYVDDEDHCASSSREQCGIRLVNVSNPQAPTTTGFYNTPGSVHGIFVTGNIAYIADGDQGVQLANVLNPADPVFLGHYANIAQANDLFVRGNRAYVAAGETDGLVVLDVAVPAAPNHVTTYNTPGSALKVFVANGTAYVADGAAGLFIQTNVP